MRSLEINSQGLAIRKERKIREREIETEGGEYKIENPLEGKNMITTYPMPIPVRVSDKKKLCY